jgi:hypothetical protein
MLKMPRSIQADKANHRVRGSEVAGVCAAIALWCFFVVRWLLALPLPAWLQFVVAAAAAAAGAYVAGRYVEWRQAQINAAAIARNELPPHAIERADVMATLKGCWPVVLVLVVLALLSGVTAALGA